MDYGITNCLQDFNADTPYNAKLCRQ